MANPQRENGHIDIANELVDHLCKYRLSGQEYQVLWVVIRKTWGYATLGEAGKPMKGEDGQVVKKKQDHIPLSQFAGLTGIDRRKCHKLLQTLVEKNVVRRIVTQRGDRKIISYGFQKDYDKWKLSPRKVTATQMDDNLSSKKVSKLSPKETPSKERKKTSKETGNLERFDRTVISLSGLLRDRILENKPDRTHPNVRGQPWLRKTASAIDRMIRLDRRDPERIRHVIEWCQSDNVPRNGNFCWAYNILSGDKLREKFDRLETGMSSIRNRGDPIRTSRGW